MKVLIILGLAALATAVPHGRQCEPTPDPSIIDANTNLNLTFDPIFKMNHGLSHSGGGSAGHSTAEVEVDINIIALTATLTANIPSIELTLSGIMGSGYLDFSPFTSIPSGDWVATGADLSLKVEGVTATASATLFINLITNKVTVRLLNIESIDFATLCTDFGPNFTIDGSTIDWPALCLSFKGDFMAEFNDAAKKNALTERIREAANLPIGNCGIDQLVACVTRDSEPCRGKQDPSPCACLLDVIFAP